MTAFTRPSLAVVLLALGASGAGTSVPVARPAAAESDTLRVGDRLTRRIRGKSRLRFIMLLRAGHVAELVVTKSNLELEFAVLDARGDTSLTRSDPAGPGAYPLEAHVVPSASGTFTLVVSSRHASASEGSFTVALSERRSLSPRDRAMMSAESLYYAANRQYATFSDAGLDSAFVGYAGALALYRTAADTARLVRTLNQLALSHLRTGGHDSARIGLNEVRAIAEMQLDTLTLAHALINLAWVEQDRGLSSAAQRLAEHAERLARAASDSAALALALNQTAVAMAGQGDDSAALARYQEAAAVFRAIGWSSYLGKVLNNTASSLGQRGHLEKALAVFQEALELWRAEGDDEQEARVLNNMGAVFANLGRAREAIEHYRQARDAAHRIRRFRLEASALTNMANALPRTEATQAIAFYRQSLALRDSAADEAGKLGELYAIGQRYLVSGNLDSSRKYLTLALGVTRATDNRRVEAIALGMLGRVYFRTGDTTRAFAALDSSLRVSASLGDLRSLAVTHRTVATYQRETGNLLAADSSIARAIALWEEQARGVAARGLRTSFASQFASDYALRVDLLLRIATTRPEGDRWVREAFAVAEQSRARALAESLTWLRDRLREGIDPAVLARERELQGAIGRAPPSASRALDSLLRIYDALETEIRTSSPRYAAVSAGSAVSLARLQGELLDPSTALLEYVVDDEGGHVFVVTRDTIAAWPIPRRAVLDTLLSGLLSDVTARTRVSSQEDVIGWRNRIAAADVRVRHRAAVLHSALLQPTLALTKGMRLLISPSEGLHRVPFALLAANAADTSSTELSQREIAYIPSASIASLLRQRGAPMTGQRPTLALIGDPVFSATDPRIKERSGTAPVTTTSRDSLLVSARDVGLVPEGTDLPRLPNTRREVAALAALVPPSQRTVSLGFGANLDVVLSDAVRSARIIHFASHALLNDARPELSGIALSQIDSSGRPVDGFLRLSHLYGTEFSADLVVLSACQTALGTTFDGEGPASLARGFLQAGAARVVASLWKVDDEATATLMSHFYRSMLEPRKLRPTEALREAQLALSRMPRWRAPFYWAGFTLQGDWR